MNLIICTCGTGAKCPVPHGLWVAARSYENGCVCSDRCPSPWCNDIGRVDQDKLPPTCCVHKISIERAKAEKLAWKIEKGYL